MSKKLNDTERVRGKYSGMQKLYVGAVDKPIAETGVLPPSALRRLNSASLVVKIDDDLLPYFMNAGAVNEALRVVVRQSEADKGHNNRKPSSRTASPARASRKVA